MSAPGEPFTFRDTAEIPPRTPAEIERYTVTEDNPALHGDVPPMGPDPFAGIAVNGDKDFPRQEPKPWQLPLVDTAAWIGRTPPPRRYIVDGWLARRTTGALYGEDGVGKSLMAQQLVTCVAAKRPFLGLEVAYTPALYLTCEDDEQSLWERQRAINVALGLPLDSCPPMLSTLVGYLASQLGDFNEFGEFEPGPMFHAIAARAKSVGAGLIALDNIAHLFPGNEIVRRQVMGFLAACDRLAMECDAAVLLLGHPAKQKDSEYSGNLGWSAHVRQRWFLTWGDPSGADGDSRILRKAKANLSKKGEQVVCRWHDWAFVRDEDLPENIRGEIALVARDTSDNTLFLACLNQRTKEQRAVSERTGRNLAPFVFASMSESKGIGKDRLNAAMDRLFRLGLIERAELWRGPDRKPVFGLRETAGNGAGNGAETRCGNAENASAETW